VNSGEVLNRDNPDLSSMNDTIVIEKEQRLIGEESTNKPSKSAGQPCEIDEYKTFIDNWKRNVYKEFKKAYG
jgi:hypothetical protein